MSERKTTPDILGEILTNDETESSALIISKLVEKESSITPIKPQPAPISKPKKPYFSKQPIPPRWNYHLATFENLKGWKLRYIDGIKKKGWKDGPFLLEYIEQMGEQGWELVCACSGVSLFGQKDNYQLFFKRPRIK